MSLDLSLLDPDQFRAVTHGEGPLLVNAGAGSGKTRVIAHRAAYLIEQGVEPRNLFLGTFTKKAGNEMRERVTQLVGEEIVSKIGHIGTLHSFGYRILRLNLKMPTVFKGYQIKRLLEELIAPASKQNPLGLGLNDDEGEEWEVKDAIREILGLKNALLLPEMYAATPGHNPKLAALYTAYEACKARGQWSATDRVRGVLVDFEDMILRTWYIMIENPNVMASLQRAYKWVLVDEGQDNNLAQYKITEAIAAPDNNITLMGDDYQSLYRFRGAQPDEFMSFDGRLDGVTVIPLGTNYRSCPEVVELGKRIISHNTRQMAKDVKAHRVSEGNQPTYKHYNSEHDEAKAIAQQVKLYLEDEVKLGEIAVLYRTNRQSRAIEDAFLAEGIDYTIPGFIGFYGRADVKLITSYYKLALADDIDALGYIINKPTRYLGAAFMRDVAKASGTTLPDKIRNAVSKSYQEKGAYPLARMIEVARQMLSNGDDAEAIIRYLVEAAGLEEWLSKKEISADDSADTDEEKSLIEEVIAAGRVFESPQAFQEHILKQEGRAPSDEPDPDKVVLTTGHRAKGLEWKIVFVTGFSAGLVPHALNEDIEEERRWAYVACTRARDILHISSTSTYAGKAAGPSPFLAEAALEVSTEHIEEV